MKALGRFSVRTVVYVLQGPSRGHGALQGCTLKLRGTGIPLGRHGKSKDLAPDDGQHRETCQDRQLNRWCVSSSGAFDHVILVGRAIAHRFAPVCVQLLS